jgi:acetyl esterase/lipase
MTPMTPMTLRRGSRGLGLTVGVLTAGTLAFAAPGAATPATPASPVTAGAWTPGTPSPSPSASGPRPGDVPLAPGGVTADAETLRDVRYAELSGAETLDLFLPRRSGQVVPLVVFVHGGAFSGGDKGEIRDVPGLLEQLQAEGYAVASVNYRLSGEAPFPAAVQDVKAAVRWLRARAAGYGIDPDRVAIWGTSAGGYLASMVGVSGDQFSGLDDPRLGTVGVSSRVQAVVSWYGPSDFTAMDRQAGQVTACAGRAQVHDEAGSPESTWLGSAVQTSALARPANPMAWLASAPAGSLPPFRFVHGGADCSVPSGQSTEFAAALTAAGVPASATIVDGAGHADDFLHRQQVRPTLDFVAASLRGRPAG